MLKYVSKPEKSTPSGDKVMCEILNHIIEDDPAATVLREIFMRMKPDRDVEKHEISHRLLQLPYVTTILSLELVF